MNLLRQPECKDCTQNGGCKYFVARKHAQWQTIADSLGFTRGPQATTLSTGAGATVDVGRAGAIDPVPAVSTQGGRARLGTAYPKACCEVGYDAWQSTGVYR